MAVATLITEERDLPFVVRWAARAARARATELVILAIAERKGNARAVEVTLPGEEEAEGLSPLAALACDEVRSLIEEGALPLSPGEEAEAETETETETADRGSESKTGNEAAAGEGAASGGVAARVVNLRHEEPLEGILAELQRLDVDLLVLPRHDPLADTDVRRLLFRRSRCETVLVRPGAEEERRECCKRVLVPLGPGSHARSALRFAREMAAPEGEVTAVYVEPEVGLDAELVGERILEREVRRALGAEADSVRRKVVLGGKVHSGIVAALEDDHDLVVVGASRHGLMVRRLFGSVSERLMGRKEGPTVAVVRAAIPLAGRLWRATEQRLQHLIPQLERESRVRLVERVQSNSQWDFDFIALVCLSTLIASLGLAQSSTAVVIGAMLVAPLMTPLLGMGLALAQGNAVLSRNAARALLLGFLLAFAIAYGIGYVLPGMNEPTFEMLARGSPGVLDFIVALASGVAAAYAISRPDLSAALPGVAIAAALVPPIATCGLATAVGDTSLAIGAALLFLTNIVSIVLGATLSLWLVGIRSLHRHGSVRSWSLRASVVLVLASASVATTLAFHHHRVPKEILEGVESRLRQVTEAELVEARWSWREDVRSLHLTITSPAPLARETLEELVAAARELLDAEIGIRLETRLVQTSPPAAGASADAARAADRPEPALPSPAAEDPAERSGSAGGSTTTTPTTPNGGTSR